MTYEELIRLGVEGAGTEKACKERMQFLKAEIKRLDGLIAEHNTELSNLYDKLEYRVPSWLRQVQMDIDAELSKQERNET